MTYITQQDLLDELGEDGLIQLSDEDGTGVIDEARIRKAISFAEGTFESYARTRYTLPVAATEKVKSVCLDLAIYKLQVRRAVTEESRKMLKLEYDTQIKFLEALSKGGAALDIPAAEETASSPASPDRVLSGSRRPVFTDDQLSNF